jgi:dihydroxyacetone kinase phosphotransfer subunit
MSAGANGAKVGIVIVSHSPDIARGTADMVRQMVGNALNVAWCGGNPAGGLGTDVAAIIASIDAAWSEAGVVVLVDLGGAEMNSEMAIEMLPEERRGKVVLCDAPIVEGAIMAATQASTGSPLDSVRAAAEELAA